MKGWLSTTVMWFGGLGERGHWHNKLTNITVPVGQFYTFDCDITADQGVGKKYWGGSKIFSLKSKKYSPNNLLILQLTTSEKCWILL